ncbi:hypothetical protein BN000_00221 [Neobacillus massiliamazoniensis]|uniref:Uncharacterized protein n=1 Tax=Neobacillus massiliamazoniensis TaxID=1499688 RepID=A0A0U1NQL4_9BACI|nr:hypothetical protein BN000_00221 [Neobacillus massiliamazoniensis]
MSLDTIFIIYCYGLTTFILGALIGHMGAKKENKKS